MRTILKSGLKFSLFIALVLLNSCSGNQIKEAVENRNFDDRSGSLKGWKLAARHDRDQDQFSAQGEPSATIENQAHSGKKSVHIVWDIPDTDSWGSLWMLTNNVLYPVKPGEIYTVTAWMKGADGFHCGKVWLEVTGLKDGAVVKKGIGKDMMNARSTWMPFEAKVIVPEGCNQMQVGFTGGHMTDLYIDDVNVSTGPPPERIKPQKPQFKGFTTERIKEKLNRGIVALPNDKKEIYISWRLLDTDSPNTGFNVYRAEKDKSPVLMTEKPLLSTTDFIDKKPAGNKDCSYFVCPVIDGKEREASEKVAIIYPPQGESYIPVKLAGDYGANRLGIGDLDGDGEYEYVIKQPKVNFDPWAGDGTPGKGFWKPSPGTYKLEAYKHDGTMMWQYDMGRAIEQGVWFSPFVIHDLDGDGSAEIALKGGEGDPRSPDGHVSTGPEFLMILDGKTGKEITRTDWIPREGYVTHEALNRNQLSVAYLDGKTPCIIAERGTYDVIALAAYTFHDNQLHEVWKWNDREEENLKYTAQGAHCVHAADVDGDGRDELVIGSAVIDDNGEGLWSNADLLRPAGGTYGFNSGSGRGHPDHCVVGELDPLHPGLEMYICYEPAMLKNGFCQIDAKTGEFLWGLDEKTFHGHYGLIADLDPDHEGVELWCGDEKLNKFWFFSPQGDILSNNPVTGRIAAYWDGDLQREYLDQKDSCLINFKSVKQTSPKFPEVPLFVGDVLGDWREEVIVVVPGEMRIYTSTIPAISKQLCLMLDPLYRNDVTQESQGYFSLPQFMKNPGQD